MYARVTTIHTNGGPEVRARFRAITASEFPRITEQPGCAGGLIVEDPTRGTIQMIALWRSAEDMLAFRDGAEQIHQLFANALGVHLAEIDVYVADVTALALWQPRAAV